MNELTLIHRDLKPENVTVLSLLIKDTIEPTKNNDKENQSN